jgi:hypothetical protein
LKNTLVPPWCCSSKFCFECSKCSQSHANDHQHLSAWQDPTSLTEALLSLHNLWHHKVHAHQGLDYVHDAWWVIKALLFLNTTYYVAETYLKSGCLLPFKDTSPLSKYLSKTYANLTENNVL